MAGGTDCLKLGFREESLGGHSLDGCGEFMASPSSNPSDPTSITCAACDCHRNFHRRLYHHSPPPPPPPQQLEQKVDDDERESPSVANDDTDENNINSNNSAPHMLMALSARGHLRAVARQFGRCGADPVDRGERRDHQHRPEAEQQEEVQESARA